MAASLVDLEARVRVLEAHSERHKEDIDAMSGTIVETRDEVRALTQEVRVLRSDMTGLTFRVDGLQRDMMGLKHDLTGLNGKVDTLDGRFNTLQRGIDAIVAHLGLSVDPDNRDS